MMSFNKPAFSKEKCAFKTFQTVLQQQSAIDHGTEDKLLKAFAGCRQQTHQQFPQENLLPLQHSWIETLCTHTVRDVLPLLSEMGEEFKTKTITLLFYINQD